MPKRIEPRAKKSGARAAARSRSHEIGALGSAPSLLDPRPDRPCDGGCRALHVWRVVLRGSACWVLGAGCWVLGAGAAWACRGVRVRVRVVAVMMRVRARVVRRVVCAV
jgi:hypothetical protein